MKDRVLNHRAEVTAGIVLALAAVSLAAGPLAAQENFSVAGPPAPKPTDIGPGELSNFSLKGTVTKPADKPAPANVAPTRPIAAPTTSAPAPRSGQPAAAAPATAKPAAPNVVANDLFRRPPTLPDTSTAPTVGEVTPVMSDLATPAVATEPTGWSILPWAIALLATAGAAFMWFRRRRGGELQAAGNAPIDIVREPAPEPQPRTEPSLAFAPRPDPIPSISGRKPLPTTLMPPPPAPTPAQPRPDPIIPGGIVSTGLRPWIDVELSPDRALLDDQGAAIAFEVVLYNSGSAAARDVIVEAKLLNAGASQDVELSAFFTAEATVSDPIPQIIPYARIPLRSAVRLPLSAISEYEYEGRKLFMPLVAISVRYRWSSGEGQSAAGFLVGQGAEGQEKLAPLRIDRGARSWNGLGVRRYEKGVRR